MRPAENEINPSHATPVVHVLGQREHAEFTELVRWLDHLDHTDDLESADLVVVLLDHPDRFSARAVERMLATAPLARWVVCAGPWCESIGRSRGAWPRAAIVPARLATSRLEAEIAVLRGERSPLPLTASRDEAWAFDHPAIASSEPTWTVRIESPDRRLAATWAAILNESGFEAVSGDADVVLLDGDFTTEGDRENGRAVVARTMPLVGEIPKLAPAAMLVESIHAALDP